MTMREPASRKRIRIAVYFSAALFSPGSPTGAQQPALDPDLARLVRTLVVDSMSGTRRYPRQVFAPADSTSRSVMRLAGVPLDTATNLNCPGSTDTTGDVFSGILGSVVKVGVSGKGNSRKISVRRSCTFVYRGGPREFRHSVDFEVKRENRHWRVTRRFNVVIT